MQPWIQRHCGKYAILNLLSAPTMEWPHGYSFYSESWQTTPKSVRKDYNEGWLANIFLYVPFPRLRIFSLTLSAFRGWIPLQKVSAPRGDQSDGIGRERTCTRHPRLMSSSMRQRNKSLNGYTYVIFTLENDSSTFTIVRWNCSSSTIIWNWIKIILLRYLRPIKKIKNCFEAKNIWFFSPLNFWWYASAPRSKM